MGYAAPEAAAAAGVRHQAEIVRRAFDAALSTSTQSGPASATTFRQFHARAKREGWRTYEIDASHNPHITNPQALLAILNEIAAHMTAARQIGIAGLGLLGSALAHRLMSAGFSPKGFDIDAAKTAAFAKAGGMAATSMRSRVATWCCSRCSTRIRSRMW